MKVLIATDWYYPHLGGVTRQIEGLASSLVAKGHQVLIVCPNSAIPEKKLSQNGIDIWRLPAIKSPTIPDLYYSWPSVRKCKKIIDNWHPDLIHSQSQGPVGWSSAMAGWDKQVPVIFTYHQYIYETPTLWSKAQDAWQWMVIRQIFAKSAEITLPSQLAADFFSQRYHFSKYKVVTNGLDVATTWVRHHDKASAKEALGLSGKRVLLYVGRLSSEKKIPEAIEGFHQYQDDQAVFIVVGNGPQRAQLEGMVKAMKDSRILFTGGLDRSGLTKYYEAADVFLFPSPIESQGLSALEAMCYGMPVLGSSEGAIGTFVIDGQDGLSYPPQSPARITASIQKFFSLSPEEQQKMGQAALEVVQALDFRKVVDLYIKLYQDTIAAYRTKATSPGIGR